jgi:hypothetical protein
MRSTLSFSFRIGDGLPLQVLDRVWSAAGERHDVIPDVSGACAGPAPGLRAGMLSLKLPRDLPRTMLMLARRKRARYDPERDDDRDASGLFHGK